MILCIVTSLNTYTMLLGRKKSLVSSAPNGGTLAGSVASDHFPTKTFLHACVVRSSISGKTTKRTRTGCMRAYWILSYRIFKMFYLANDNFDLKSIFNNKSVSTRSLKLAPMLICFEKKNLD
jgi:hypothetical protein